MKFEDYLAEQGDDKQKHQHQRRHVLEEEVKELQADLDEQQAIGKVLQSALHGPVLPPHPCIASLLPPQVSFFTFSSGRVVLELTWFLRNGTCSNVCRCRGFLRRWRSWRRKSCGLRGK
ncbi:hypothetical protein LINPERPRIM_LOCUS9622 [Linum perenne]